MKYILCLVTSSACLLTASAFASVSITPFSFSVGSDSNIQLMPSSSIAPTGNFVNDNCGGDGFSINCNTGSNFTNPYNHTPSSASYDVLSESGTPVGELTLNVNGAGVASYDFTNNYSDPNFVCSQSSANVLHSASPNNPFVFSTSAIQCSTPNQNINYSYVFQSTNATKLTYGEPLTTTSGSAPWGNTGPLGVASQNDEYMTFGFASTPAAYNDSQFNSYTTVSISSSKNVSYFAATITKNSNNPMPTITINKRDTDCALAGPVTTSDNKTFVVPVTCS